MKQIGAEYFVFSVLQHRGTMDMPLFSRVEHAVIKVLNSAFPRKYFVFDTYSMAAFFDYEQQRAHNLMMFHDVLECRKFLDEACCSECRNLAAMSGLRNRLETTIKRRAPRFMVWEGVITRTPEFDGDDIQKLLESHQMYLIDEEHRVAQAEVKRLLEEEECQT